jgi:hypothetical protein
LPNQCNSADIMVRWGGRSFEVEVHSALALSGDLKDFGLLQLLTLMQVTGKTGSLTLERRGERATIFFKNGELLRVRTPESRSESLATGLLKAGKITRDQHHTIESSVPASEKAAALFITDQGILSRDEIIEFIREKSISSLYWLITWLEGSFRMDIDANPPDEDITASTNIAAILSKGQSYLDEWRTLAARIPDLDKNIRLLPVHREETAEVRMGLAEWQLVLSLAKEAPLKEVAAALDLDEFQIRKVVYKLLDAGLADLSEPKVESAPVEESIPEPAEEKTGSFWSFGKRK